MHPHHFVDLRSSLAQLASILSLRLLPFVTYALLSRAIVRGRKTSAAATYLAVLGVACALGGAWSVVFTILGSVYYLLICLWINWLSNLLRAKRLTRGTVLVLLFVLFLLIPGVLLPGLAGAFLAFGWELALSSYSYCVETSRPGMAPAPVGECLFFLLVNPTVVYTARGARATSTARSPGLARTTAGVAIMFLSLAVLTPAVTALRYERPPSPGAVALALVMFGGFLRFVAFYAAHSGLASLQIGMMRQLGWVVPERYRYPFLATSPMDFWRRWNVYVRLWLEAYVFWPLARRAARSNVGRWGQVLAAVVTLIASGLLHDAFWLASSQVVTGSSTMFFLAAGAVLLAWRLLSEASEALLSRLHIAPARFELAGRWSARIGMAGALIAAAVVWEQ